MTEAHAWRPGCPVGRPGIRDVRGPGRINRILNVVLEFIRYAVVISLEQDECQPARVRLRAGETVPGAAGCADAPGALNELLAAPQASPVSLILTHRTLDDALDVAVHSEMAWWPLGHGSTGVPGE